VSDLPETLFGLCERAAAVESAIYLAKQFKEIFTDSDVCSPDAPAVTQLRYELITLPATHILLLMLFFNFFKKYIMFHYGYKNYELLNFNVS